VCGRGRVNGKEVKVERDCRVKGQREKGREGENKKRFFRTGRKIVHQYCD
jgi:hypothetical protein